MASKLVLTKLKCPTYSLDILILVEGDESNVRFLKMLIQCFEMVSGFKVS